MGMNNGRISIGLSGGNAVDEVVVVADDAARLALPVSEGLLVLQLDRDEIWEYDLTTASWVRIAGIEAANPFTFAGYNGVGENRPIPGWFYIEQPTQVQAASYQHPALLGTETDYGLLQDTTPLDGAALNTLRGLFVNTLIGNVSAISIANYEGVHIGPTFAVNATPVNAQAFKDTTNYQAGPASNSHIGHWTAAQVDRDINSVQGFISQMGVGNVSAADVNFFTEFGAFSTFGANADIGQYFGFQLSPSFSGVGALTGYQGITMTPSLDVVGFNSWRTISTGGAIGQVSATDINNWIDLQISPNFGSFVDLTTGYTGMTITPIFAVGGISGGAIQLMQFNASVEIASVSTFAHAAFNSQLGITNPVSITNMYGINVNDNYGANLTLGSVTGIAYRPNVTAGATVSGGWTGFDVGANAALPVAGTAVGLNIDMTNFQTTTQKVGVQVNDGLNTFYSNYDTSVYSATPGFMNQHALGGQFHVASGSPMTVTLSTGLNIGQANLFEDDMGPDAFGGFLGRVDLFNAGQIAIAAGKTVDTYHNAVFAQSVPVTGVTGGTLVNASMVTAGGIFPQGGDTISITNLYGFRVLPIFNTFAATNAWGVYVEDTTVDNYFSKSISINTVTQKSAAGVGLEIYQKDLLLDEGEFWAFDPAASGFKVVVKAPALLADTAFTLPPTNGAVSELLTTDGAGNTSWSNVPIPAVVNPPAAAQSLNNNDTITIDDTRQKNITFVSGNAAAITVDATTGITDGTFNGQEAVIVGMDDTNTVTLDSVGNVEINGSVTLGYHDSITLMWDNTNAVWFELARS